MVDEKNDKIPIEEYTLGFDKGLKEQKLRSKSGSTMQGDVFGAQELELKGLADTVFVGYDDFSAKTKILKIFKDDQEVDEVKEGDDAKIILEKTSFYAEQGGQVGDIGILQADKNIFEVENTRKIDHVILHIGKLSMVLLKKAACFRLI